jgi:hypothetical protein
VGDILDKLRRDDLARSTPGRETIEDNDILLDGIVESSLVGNVVDTHFGSGRSKSSSKVVVDIGIAEAES